MKRVFLIFLLVPAVCLAFQNEPDGFRGIRWGTDLNTLQGMTVFSAYSDDNIFYQKQGDSLKVGDAELTGVYYVFYKKKFYSVMLTFEKYTEFAKLRDIFFQKYGEGVRLNRYLEKYKWESADVVIALDYSTVSKKGNIIYWYMPIQKELKADNKEKAKKAGNDL